jgi:hypothetical protein
VPEEEEQEGCDSRITAEGSQQVKYGVYMGLSVAALMVAISDRYQRCRELIAEGRFAENGKLVDQHGMNHQCFEACIHRASLA